MDGSRLCDISLNSSFRYIQRNLTNTKNYDLIGGYVCMSNPWIANSHLRDPRSPVGDEASRYLHPKRIFEAPSLSLILFSQRVPDLFRIVPKLVDRPVDYVFLYPVSCLINVVPRLLTRDH